MVGKKRWLGYSWFMNFERVVSSFISSLRIGFVFFIFSLVLVRVIIY